MRLPPFSNQPSSSRPSTTGRLGRSRPPLSVSPLSSLDNTILSPVTRQTLDHVTEETDYDPPPSQEVKSPAYPQGPVCIYDPLVYLYLEPSHVEARQFDVVLNVAREVKNPFHAIRGNDRESQAPDAGVDGAPNTDSTRLAGRDSSYPQTAKPQDSSYSTSEAQSEDVNSTAAGTPKAPRPEPEYIHVPWDHNTNVVDDLLKLCELVDNRVRQEKRVLVHCQCGVSRSASLVVAYGLYKNPQLTVQEAYDAVKFRSRWIGPNMNLIYQLSEFKSKLLKSHPMGTSWLSWRSLGSGCSNPNALRSPSAMAGLPSSAHRSPPQISMSVPSPIGHEPSVKRSNSLNPRNSAELAPASTQGEIIPSPSSAPPYMQWSPGHAPMEPDNVALSSNCKVTRDAVSLPKSTDANASMTFPPSTTDREGIEEKVSAPVGGVADDLQEVAKCLINRDHGSVSMTPQKVMASDGDLALSTAALDVGTAEKTKAGSANDIEPAAHLDCGPYESAAICPLKSVGLSTLPASPMVQERMKSGPSIPTRSPALSAGFSSLLSRRHGPFGLRQLPIYPRLTTSRPLPRALDPDIPPTPSLLSPRAAEFTASPFHRTAAGDLAGSSLFEQGLMSPGVTKDDPRSPHQKGEAPITRSIFDMI